MNDWLQSEVETAVAEVWMRWAREGSAEREFLWFRRGALRIAAEKPEGYELGDGAALPSHVVRSALIGWVLERARRLPCLPESSAGDGER